MKCFSIFLLKDRDGHEQPSPESPGGESDVIGSGMADTAIQGPNVSDEKLAWKEPMFSMLEWWSLWMVCLSVYSLYYFDHE